MARASDISNKKTKAAMPSYAIESAVELSKLRSSHPVSSGFFSLNLDQVESSQTAGRILFCRGDFAPSALLEESLKRHQYQVTSVQEIDVLNELLEKNCYDLLMLDHALPFEKRILLTLKIKHKQNGLAVLLVFPPLTDSEVQRVPANIFTAIRDMDGAYLLKIPDIIREILQAQKDEEKPESLIPTLSLTDETTEQVNLQEVANGLLGDINASKKASLVVLAGPDVGRVSHLGEDAFLIGRDPTCHLQLKDESISRFHARIYLDDGQLTVKDLASTNGTYISGKRINESRLNEGDKLLLGQDTLIKYQKQDAIDKSYYDELYFSSTRDGLTGIYNRRFCQEKIKTDLSYARRHNLPVSLMLLDVDHFKRVNDAYGHPTGDVVLSAIAEVTANTVRTEDILGRYGGEEFIIFAMDTPHLGAQIFAERIRDAIENREIMAIDGSRKIIHATVSIGIATTTAKSCYDWEKLVTESDANLYKAKAKGRNCVIASELFE